MENNYHDILYKLTDLEYRLKNAKDIQVLNLVILEARSYINSIEELRKEYQKKIKEIYEKISSTNFKSEVEKNYAIIKSVLNENNNEENYYYLDYPINFIYISILLTKINLNEKTLIDNFEDIKIMNSLYAFYLEIDTKFYELKIPTDFEFYLSIFEVNEETPICFHVATSICYVLVKLQTFIKDKLSNIFYENVGIKKPEIQKKKKVEEILELFSKAEKCKEVFIRIYKHIEVAAIANELKITDRAVRETINRICRKLKLEPTGVIQLRQYIYKNVE